MVCEVGEPSERRVFLFDDWEFKVSPCALEQSCPGAAARLRMRGGGGSAKRRSEDGEATRRIDAGPERPEPLGAWEFLVHQGEYWHHVLHIVGLNHRG